MQVSFNGLYRITGSPYNAEGNGETIHNISNRKLEAFIEDTQKFRNGKGSIYYDEMTQDLFIPVNDDKDMEFEEKLKIYNIDYTKVGSRIARNSASPSKIVEALTNFRMGQNFGFPKK